MVAHPATAHELNPTIADLTITDGKAELTLRLNAEAFLAGLDLDALIDTDEATEADRYDTLQDRPGDEIANEFKAQSDSFLQGLSLNANETAIPLTLDSVQTPAASIPEVARLSLATFTAQLPENTRNITVAWGQGYGAFVLRQQGVEDPYTGILQGGDTSPAIPVSGGGEQSSWRVFASYIPVGFDHIVPQGLDHILFVLGLFFLSLKLSALLWQVSAFTLAHTVTLALGVMGWVTIPGSIVEPIIAASIVYVGVENILSKGNSPSRPLFVFGFGLLHGLGFATVLGEFGLPSGQIIPALIGFNVGVEVGQLTVIAVAFLAVGLWFGRKPWYRKAIANPASAVIALVGAYWFIERVFL